MPTSESYKSFVNLNGVSVEDRLGDYIKKMINKETHESTVEEIRSAVRTLQSAYVISDESADSLIDQILVQVS